MARKRKKGARYACGKLKPTTPYGPDRGTEERRMRNKNDTRDEALSADYPLHVLVGRGLLAVDERGVPDRAAAMILCDAAHAYGDRCRALWGSPYGNAAPMERRDRSHDTHDNEAQVRRLYERERAILDGRGIRDAVELYAYRLVRDWFIREVIDGTAYNGDRLRPRHQRRLDTLRAALADLAKLNPREARAA